MARSDYGPEVKASMDKPTKRPSQVKKAAKETPADQARDVKAGIPEGSPQDMKLDAQPQNQMPPVSGHGGSPAHAAMAASIAHAILGHR